MRTRPFRIIATLAVLVAMLPFGSLAQAQEPVDPSRIRFPTQRPQLTPGVQLAIDGVLNEMTGPSQVILELADPATAQTFASARATGASAAQATAQAQRQLTTVNAAQQNVVRQVQAAAIGAKVLYRTQRVFNGIAVQVDAAKFAQIKALPGVKAVYPLIPKERDHTSSVPLIGAPQAWNGAGLGIKGEGIKVGIIDTGIDYLHTNFGGPGTPEAYAANNTTVVGDSPFFPSAKVASGYDFAGDAYDASTPATSTPAPDPDPMDCEASRGGGHGSHVAGTAGGYGVNADGSTYRGPYGTDTNFNALRIGPGVAPQALLYALRVFGCNGSTNLTDAAIEWAVDPNRDGDFSDRLDVINMSLGSNFGSPFDSSLVASDNAASIGLVVVASAGNSGDTYFVSGAPGGSGRTISVASSVDSTDIVDGFRINAPPAIAGVKPSSNSANFDYSKQPSTTGEVVYPPTQRSGCEAFTPANAALIRGKIALVDWILLPGGGNQCGSATIANNVTNAGGIGVIMVYPSTFLEISIAGNDKIPATITVQSVGDQIKSQLAAGQIVNATITNEYNGTQRLVAPERNDTLSSFSSRGPRRGDNFLKPDIAAPGQTIFSTSAGTGTQGESLNGTSMAAPHIAGVMALLRQLHPDWSVEELKALAMNTATNDLRSTTAQNSQIYGPGRVGAGRVDVPKATAAQAVAYNATDPGLVSVSFGVVEVVGSAQAVKKIRVLNKSDQALTYNVAYRPVVVTPGVQYALSASTVSLQPYGSADVFVTMTATSARMKHTRDLTVGANQSLPRHWLSEAAGYVVMTGQQQTLRVPIHAAARPASDMRATQNTIAPPADTSQGSITLRGQQVLTGVTFPNDEVSVVTAYELQHSSPNDARTEGIANNGDLQYVGLSTNLQSANRAVEGSTLSFGLATHGDWSTPNEVSFTIYIDTNKDNRYDYVLYNRDYGRATGGGATDAFITVLEDLSDGSGSLQYFLNGASAAQLNTVPFNNNVMMLPVFAGDLGLTNANSTFNYRVFTYSRDLETEEEDIGVGPSGRGFVDASPVLTYDAARPGIEFTDSVIPDFPVYLDLNGTSIPYRYDGVAFRNNRSQGVLLLHHHNARDRRPEVVRVTGTQAVPRYKVYVPLTLNREVNAGP